MNQIKFIKTLFVGAILLISACERWENRHLKRSVSEAELLGQWQMTRESLADLRRVGHTEMIDPTLHTITLRSEGFCRFATFPTALTSQGLPHVRVDQDCHWSLQQKGGQTLLIDLPGSPAIHTHFYFGNDDSGGLILWRSATDPDLELYVEYERRSSNPNGLK